MRMIAVLAALFATPIAAAPLGWSPDTIPWQPANPDGTRFALLEGVRDKAGVPFTYAFFIPADVWDGPHSHKASARVVVARGRLRLGYGTTMNKVARLNFQSAVSSSCLPAPCISMGPPSTRSSSAPPSGRGRPIMSMPVRRHRRARQ